MEKLNAFYGPVQILHDINIAVETGQVVGLVGANAAGKTTLLFSLAGLRTRCTGSILLADERIDTLAAYERVGRGLVLVPERRRLFPFMTVMENLEIGAYSAAARAARNETLQEVYKLLPVLAERSTQRAGSLSGGEQQMLAIGRALMSKPRVLLLDEPTEGLAPRYVNLLYQLVRDLRRQGHTILIVEQSVQHILRIADRAYVLEHGHIVMEGPGHQLLNDERLKVAYLGM
ncbi:MAG TPA: ABC transporter ATP-binding protein [Xanthobacteraceae bacterium]|nr:ABC transporter ATP-binding protein [Xanthobacteraceae bacterium]